MKNILTLKGMVFILTIILCFSFATLKNISTETNKSIIYLVDEKEEGKHIKIEGQLIDKTTNQVLAHTEIFFFQANNKGLYEAKIKNKERTARISGKLITDKDGFFIVHTIMPGNYPDAPKGRAHIHAEVTRNNHKKVIKDLLFEHDVSAEVRAWAKSSGNGIILKLKEFNSEEIAQFTLKI